MQLYLTSIRQMTIHFICWSRNLIGRSNSLSVHHHCAPCPGETSCQLGKIATISTAAPLAHTLATPSTAPSCPSSTSWVRSANPELTLTRSQSGWVCVCSIIAGLVAQHLSMPMSIYQTHLVYCSLYTNTAAYKCLFHACTSIYVHTEYVVYTQIIIVLD